MARITHMSITEGRIERFPQPSGAHGSRNRRPQALRGSLRQGRRAYRGQRPVRRTAALCVRNFGRLPPR